MTWANTIKIKLRGKLALVVLGGRRAGRSVAAWLARQVSPGARSS